MSLLQATTEQQADTQVAEMASTAFLKEEEEELPVEEAQTTAQIIQQTVLDEQ